MDRGGDLGSHGHILGGGGRVYFHAKHHLALTASEIMVRDPRPPILYLRSFRDDATTVPYSFLPITVGINLLTEEERLAWVFREFGPFVALGSPVEESAPPGAGRMYALNGQWQAIVTELMVRARMVVLRVDDESEALMWEFLQAVTHLDPKQLLLLIPHHPEEYERFRRSINECQQLRYPLPVWPRFSLLDSRKTVCGVIFFHAGWRPGVIRLRRSRQGPRAVERRIKKDLRPVFEQLTGSRLPTR